MNSPPGQRSSRYEAIAPFTLHYGAYRLRVVFVSRKQFTRDRRRLSEVDLNGQLIRLDTSLLDRPAVLAEHFMRVCIRLIHHVNGLSDNSIRSEESFTHSLANGLVSLAHRNPHAWVWFNALLSEHFTAQARLHRVLISDQVHVRGMPKRLNFGRHVVTLHWWPKRLAVRHQEWGYFDCTRNRIHLSRELHGPHLAVIALHEIMHAIHHHGGCKTGDRNRFIRQQAGALTAFIRRNPNAWRWLLRLIRSTAHQPVTRSARRAANDQLVAGVLRAGATAFAR
jgi:hypothetical protein